jgi:very-short-patch-repair endonuclease
MRRKYSEKFIRNIKWEEVQNFYDDNHFWKDIKVKFGFTDELISQAVKDGVLKMRSRSESNKIECRINPKSHTQETKDKISISRKEYLKNNPDKVPYLLNHSSKESYPEKYFTEVFSNESIGFVKSYRIGLYELDFCLPDKKIDIEIDGSQHRYDKKIVESDIRRTEFLEENGWDVIRINWSDYQRLSKDDKYIFISNLKRYIYELTERKPTIKVIDNSICECGLKKYKTSKSCNKCRGESDRKVERPTYEDLLKDISDLGYCGTGRKYGVSDNSIRKWIKNYQTN